MRSLSDAWVVELFAVATEAAAALPSEQLKLRLALSLAAGHLGNVTLAAEQLRLVGGAVSSTIATSYEHPMWAAEAMHQCSALADQCSESDLAESLRGATRAFTLAARNNVREQPSLAPRLFPIAMASGDAETVRWLEALDGEARLALDFERLAQLKRSDDPTWETLFDSLEQRSATLDAEGQLRACDALLRADLPRAAAQHWAETRRHLHPALLHALWHAELTRQYDNAVESVRRLWVESAPRDWSWVGNAVELSLAQHRAGDVSGALKSAQGARALAEENAEQASRGDRPPEVASWSLAHLIPLDVALGDSDSAHRVLERCRALLKAPIPSGLHKSWKGARATTLTSLVKACDTVGWYDDACTFLKGPREQLKRQLMRLTDAAPSPAVRALLAPVTAPERVQLVLELVAANGHAEPWPTVWALRQ